MPKILNFVKKIHYCSKLFTSLLGRDGCWKAFANGAGCESEADGDDSEDVAFIAGLIDHVRAVHMYNRGPEYDERVIVTG